MCLFSYSNNQGVMPNVPSSNEYKGGFGSALMLKDLGLSQDAATRWWFLKSDIKNFVKLQHELIY